MADPYVIGLTGNIATGKSTVAAMLLHLAAYVLDADRLAHQIMRLDGEVNQRIVDRFGPRVLLPDGNIDRRYLGSIVFRDAKALADLEAVVHPAVRAEAARRLRACPASVCVVEAIKLLEAQMHAECDVVWVVTCPRVQQVERLMRTRGMSRQEAELRIDTQPPAEEKVSRADRVIDNAGDLQSLWQQVLAGWLAIPDAPPVRGKTWPPAEEATR